MANCRLLGELGEADVTRFGQSLIAADFRGGDKEMPVGRGLLANFVDKTLFLGGTSGRAMGAKFERDDSADVRSRNSQHQTFAWLDDAFGFPFAPAPLESAVSVAERFLASEFAADFAAPEEAAATQSRGVTRTPRTLNPNFDVVVSARCLRPRARPIHTSLD